MKQKNKSEELVTKGFLRSELDELKKEIDENAQGYRDEILTSNDKLMKKLETMQDENTIGSGQTSGLRDDVEDHEKRIKHLEKIQTSA